MEEESSIVFSPASDARSMTASSGILERGGGRRLEELKLLEVEAGEQEIVGIGGGGYAGIFHLLLFPLCRNVESRREFENSCEGGGGGGGRGFSGEESDMDESGRAGGCSVGKLGETGERVGEITLDSSLLYHSESDSVFESDEASESDS